MTLAVAVIRRVEHKGGGRDRLFLLSLVWLQALVLPTLLKYASGEWPGGVHGWGRGRTCAAARNAGCWCHGTALMRATHNRESTGGCLVVSIVMLLGVPTWGSVIGHLVRLHVRPPWAAGVPGGGKRCGCTMRLPSGSGSGTPFLLVLDMLQSRARRPPSHVAAPRGSRGDAWLRQAASSTCTTIHTRARGC